MVPRKVARLQTGMFLEREDARPEGRMFLVATLLSTVTSTGPDSLQAARFLGLAGNPAPVPPGVHWVVVSPETPSAPGVLLGNGTEAARLDSLGWKRFERWRSDSLPGSSEIAPQRASIPLQRDGVSWILPPSGGELAFGWSTSEGEDAAPWSDLEGQLVWRQSVGQWVSLGGGVAFQQQTPSWQTLPADPQLGAVVTACAPVLCWEMRQKASPYPDAAVFEKDLDTLVIRKRLGKLLKRLPSQAGSYWQQTLDAHVGPVHWKGTFASDAWDGLLQQVSLEDIPAGVLRWGVSLAWTSDEAMTGFSLATTPWKLAGWRLGGYRQELSWEVAQMDLLFARTDQARFAVSTRLMFSDPLHAGAAK